MSKRGKHSFGSGKHVGLSLPSIGGIWRHRASGNHVSVVSHGWMGAPTLTGGPTVVRSFLISEYPENREDPAPKVELWNVLEFYGDYEYMGKVPA